MVTKRNLRVATMNLEAAQTALRRTATKRTRRRNNIEPVGPVIITKAKSGAPGSSSCWHVLASPLASLMSGVFPTWPSKAEEVSCLICVRGSFTFVVNPFDLQHLWSLFFYYSIFYIQNVAGAFLVPYSIMVRPRFLIHLEDGVTSFSPPFVTGLFMRHSSSNAGTCHRSIHS